MAEMDEVLTAALADVTHCGDYGILWVNKDRRLVHMTMGDSDGDPDSGYTTFDEIRERVTNAMQPFWPGWFAGKSDMGGRDGDMEIADEWQPNEDDEDWHEVGRIGREAMTKDQIIVCRARVSERCLQGKPMSTMVGEPGSMAEDGTYDGSSIVCDSCYVALMPLTPSGRGLTHELPAAIAKARAR